MRHRFSMFAASVTSRVTLDLPSSNSAKSGEVKERGDMEEDLIGGGGGGGGSQEDRGERKRR